MEKPRLWKYKSGIKKGKLRPKAKQYLSIRLKEYYSKKKKINKIIKEQFREKEKTYYINFSIENTKNYVKGYLASPFKINLNDGIDIIKSNMKVGYTPISFYEAEEESQSPYKNPLLVVFREEEKIYSTEVLL